jgi:hypothetical protein
MWLLDYRYLEDLYDPEFMPAADRNAAMQALAGSAVSRDVVFRHLRDNWQEDPVPDG